MARVWYVPDRSDILQNRKETVLGGLDVGTCILAISFGIRRFNLADPMNDVDAQIAGARMVKEVGGEFVIAALVYTLSPIHDDAHYVNAARRLAACPDIDALYIKDPGGLLLPQRARVLIPAIKAVIGDKKLELHSHGTIGLDRMDAVLDLSERTPVPADA